MLFALQKQKKERKKERKNERKEEMCKNLRGKKVT